MTDKAPEGFAQRWSRRKTQSSVSQPAPSPNVPCETPAVETPPDAASIPLEDITAWLGRTIPDGWREIALRRMWSADISIRDFVGPADYAWDWNTPGGAPGWGPMRAADDLVRLLSRAIGEDLPPDPDAAPPPEPPPPSPLAELTLAQAPAAIPVAEPDDILPPGDAPSPPQPLASAPPTAPGPPHAVRPRRGGRAAPV